MIYQHLNGWQTYYETFGDKKSPPIFLIHGLGADGDMYAPQTEFLSHLGYFVIVPDMISHGKSSKVQSLSLTDWTAQLVELMDELKIQKASFLGVSMGGVIALQLAASEPGRINSLIVSDTFGELKTPREKFLGKSQLAGFKLFKRFGTNAYIKGLMKTYQADYAFKARNYLKKAVQSADFDQLILARQAINQIDVLDQLRGHSYHALVITGTGFGRMFIDIVKKVADALNTPLVKLDNAMDPSNLVNPAVFNQTIKQFLTQKE